MKKKRFHSKGRRHSGPVRAKKNLGQHFLTDENVAQKISDTLSLTATNHIIEIGPGTGVLTKHLLQRPIALAVMEIDQESVAYLKNQFSLVHPQISHKAFTIIEANFLTYDITTLFPDEQFCITGNFPYNISTQIVFKTLENRHRIPEFSGMFQKEVAKRICESPGSKTYGILSVLTQAFYETEYLFTVPPSVFSPPPKVDSGVLKLTRKQDFSLDCDEKLFFNIVKMGFQQRRKTLRNSLKRFGLKAELTQKAIFSKRPEQLSIEDFVTLTQLIAQEME